ncbi:hypothetical protein CARUB_v10019620mg, partial [Capsella rubella]
IPSHLHQLPLQPFSTPTLTSGGDSIVDCVDLYSQQAFYDDRLRSHKIQQRPSEIPKPVEIRKNSKWKTFEAHVSTWQCPSGSVPVRNYELTTSTSVVSTYSHEHAVVKAETSRKLYGAKGTMSVWNPTVESEGEFSLSQIWITSGNYESNNLNSIEVGWHVSPDMYQDNKPRLFIYWTSDTYNITGCYNLQCAGFIQVSDKIVLGGAISPVSTFEGNQYEITMSVWKDQKSGNWWLSLGSNHSLVGYWPAAIFANLAYAENVEWGGEIVNSQTFGRHTATRMGSGHFPDEGFGKVSYIRNLEIFDNNRFQPVQDVEVKLTDTDPRFYNIKDMFRDDWGTYIFFGGPGFSQNLDPEGGDFGEESTKSAFTIS